MLTPLMNFDDNFKLLIEEIRLHRKNMPNCPSAQDGVSVNNLIKEGAKLLDCYEDLIY